jgi:hypothetical protein
MSSVMMSTSVSKAMNAFSAEVIRSCALKYDFDGEEAIRELSVVLYAGKKAQAQKKDAASKSVARAIPSIPLPFTGTIREDCCIGVKQNHGLYTQCFSAPGENGLCKGCGKQASKNASGEPDCGLIAKRAMQGSEYRDAKGRAPVHYTKVMKKQKLTEEQVLVEAAKFGIEIDASHFAAPQAQQKRGRPKKATTSDTESETSASLASGDKKKTRGRPKKAAKVVEVSATEDLFASLMQQAQSASPRPSASLSAANAGGGAAADEMSDVSSNSESESDSESKGSKKKTKKSKEESEEELADKAAKFLAKEEEKEKKAQAKAEAKALAQQEKEQAQQKKAAEKEQAQQEKAKKLQEKEQAQQEKALAQQKKEAEKEQAQQEKALAQQKKLAEKEAAKTAKTAKTAKEEKPKKEKASKKKAEEPAKPVEPVADLESEAESEDDTSEAEEPVVTVKKFEYEGVTYLKSSDGVLYDAKSQSVVGKWNEALKSIEVYDLGDSEEEEDSDSDEE